MEFTRIGLTVSALAALFLAGCASRIQPNQSVFVYVAPNKAITYGGDTFQDPESLPKELIKSGVTPQNQIIIVPQGDVKTEYLIDLAKQCGRGGLPNVAIREPYEASSFTQKRGTGIVNEQKAPRPPKVNFADRKIKKR